MTEKLHPEHPRGYLIAQVREIDKLERQELLKAIHVGN